ncbi:MAG: plasma-membrane proton-efflux P-type ATPase [Candidatus Omnitrophica bacterium]|nr:plasma-membrane proton-efflux P-type ATPase [Candidatus Omnitrophota bacterium]MDD5771184.1 plasma-membrane proton-efflux P-type ATPase [Candidatus Omnitrophota bacterium]
MNTEEAKQMPLDEVFSKLSSSKAGLSMAEAEARFKKNGPNEISEKRISPLRKFLGYFWGPIPWMIEIAAILSALIRHWEDFGVIFAMLLINSAVGFLQEYKADNAIELLKKRLALKARVLRDGKWAEVLARTLVSGDVIRVRLGDIIPADIKLLEGDYLLVDQAALTGESLPVEKHSSDIGYSASIVKQGEMDALVIGTGSNTYFGKTAKLVSEAKTRSHFQKAVIKIGDYLIVIAIALVAVIFMAALFRHEGFFQILQFALILVVASIPVAMPAVLTVTMAVGASILARKEAIVSKLVAIEEMAGVDVLCSDKTGTITKNELTVKELKPLGGFGDADMLLCGRLASREEDKDPIDDTIIARAAAAGGSDDYRIVSFKPFDPVNKRTEASIEGADGSKFKVTKGAPQAILSLVENKDLISGEMESAVDEFASKGYRSLGVARTDKAGLWQYVGLFAIYDPPREDSLETIKTAEEMGLNVKMVTGDHAAVAREIAREVGAGENILPASSFLDKPDIEAQKIIEEADGFAQVFPEHKYKIVEELQAKNHIVGMTGDGVNDAPALKKADAGIAVAGATDAAKSAAAIVLTKPGLSVIIDAIRESRKIFKRMNSYAIYRIAETIRVLLFMTFAILIFNFYPVTAIMIVLLAMLNDLPIMMIAYDKTKIYPGPVSWNMRRVLSISTVLGVIGVFASFGMFWIGRELFRLGLPEIQTLIFLKLAVAGHMTIYLARTGEEPFWHKPYPALSLVLVCESTKVIATLFAVYGIFMRPIGWGLALFVWGYSIAFFVITDFIKIRVDKMMDHFGIRFSRGVQAA